MKVYKMIQLRNPFGAIVDFKCEHCNHVVLGRGIYCDNCGVKLELSDKVEDIKDWAPSRNKALVKEKLN